MANRPTGVENITVHQVGKYGVRIGESLWYGVNEPLTPQNFIPGGGYKVSVTVSKTGKKYIQEILGVEAAQESVAPASPTPVPKAKVEEKRTTPTTSSSGNPTRAGFGQPLTDYDVAIQRQISRAGVYQAALNSPALAQWAVSIDEYLALVRKAADAGVKYIAE